ncbi:protein S100-Z isoform X1 [Hippocampus zosterae]|uniref:protein S100-Z isoform X1 n=2 Tax=Hippocampus zosterae TaxID=109293 RepID=UPI00223D0738|nr:protein S100-Z isoform X1 [Hippocampus zosterae]XP_051907690.1 protein S100-Z isoform X1 [Hippocampus zosterae]XP_051907691.1 protein S100-Z isoform X1 [Hippocampus zosterae]XP_051907692.1 protein S100-Z isoform X1 [Hippocampus zosterae]
MIEHRDGEGARGWKGRWSPWMLSPVELITPSGGPLQLSTPTPPICGSLPDKQMPSQLEGAMDALIAVFYNYSGHDGDKYKLNKGELKQLLHTELTDFLTSQKDPLLVEKIMSDLDSNKDNEVDFNEFVVLVAALTVACNDFFQEQNKKTTK